MNFFLTSGNDNSADDSISSNSPWTQIGNAMPYGVRYVGKFADIIVTSKNDITLHFTLDLDLYVDRTPKLL